MAAIARLCGMLQGHHKAGIRLVQWEEREIGEEVADGLLTPPCGVLSWPLSGPRRRAARLRLSKDGVQEGA